MSAERCGGVWGENFHLPLCSLRLAENISNTAMTNNKLCVPALKTLEKQLSRVFSRTQPRSFETLLDHCTCNGNEFARTDHMLLSDLHCFAVRLICLLNETVVFVKFKIWDHCKFFNEYLLNAIQGTPPEKRKSKQELLAIRFHVVWIFFFSQILAVLLILLLKHRRCHHDHFILLGCSYQNAKMI